jgi:glyoxylase-like metal-dependent hydrolase (beta-lactamase superfamily II)
MPDLHLDVYVAPMRPMRGAPAQGPGDDPMWSPMSSTLIHGEHDAVLVDTLVAFDQVDALADWVQSFGKRLTAIYITHGHADHWIGLSRLLERFPDALPVEGIVSAMLELHPDRGNPRVVWHSAREAVKKRQEA